MINGVRAWNGVWLTVAFFSELVALAVLAVWGWSAGGTTPVRLALAVGIPLVAAVLWGLFAAHRAPVRLPVLVVLVKVLVLGGAAAALAALGQPVWAVVFGVLAALGALLPTPPPAPVTARPDR